MLNDKENINNEQEAHHLHSTVKCFLFPSLLSNCNYSLLKLKPKTHKRIPRESVRTMQLQIRITEYDLVKSNNY